MLADVAPWLVVMVACLWLAVWAVCLLMALRFVLVVVVAGVMTAWESFRGTPPGGAA